MPQTSISIRMDSELKNQFESFCKNVGMTMTTAICVFAKKTVGENRIPFEITATPNAETEKALGEAKRLMSDRNSFAYNVDLIFF